MLNTFEQLDIRERSIVRVLTQGSGIRPIPISEVQHHLTETDTTGWQIILKELVQKPEADVRRILLCIDQISGVQFTAKQLTKMLLGLDGAHTIASKLTID